jgi:2'-5' RNA ligase
MVEIMADRIQNEVEAALVIPVPEAEPFISRLRMEYDPTEALGVPAHITINYPFLPGAKPTADLMVELANHFAHFEPFEYKLQKIAHFPQVVYLTPDPVEPFITLTEGVAVRFPESPPYRGEFDTIVPHLTVAHPADNSELEAMVEELKQALAGHLPIRARAGWVSLMDNKDERWQRRADFPLGGEGRRQV